MFAILSLVLAAAPSQLTLEVKPAETIIFVDGKRVGDASKPRTLKLKAGPHEVKLTYKGDSHTDEVVVKAGEKLTWRFTFEDDRPPSQPTVDEGKADDAVDPP